MSSKIYDGLVGIGGIEAIASRVLESSKDLKSFHCDILNVHLMSYRGIKDPENGMLISDYVYEKLKGKFFQSASGEFVTFDKKYGGTWRQIRKAVNIVSKRHNNPIAAPKKGVNGARKSWIVNGKSVDYITMAFLESVSDSSVTTNFSVYSACFYIAKAYESDKAIEREAKKNFLLENKIYVDAFIKKMLDEAISNSDRGKVQLWRLITLNWIANGDAPFGGNPFTLEEVIKTGKYLLEKSSDE